MPFLYDFQEKAVKRMRDGCILCGGVGSGKSRTSLAYYFLTEGGKLDPDFKPLPSTAKKLYIITTAKKRDSLEWDKELIPFLLTAEAIDSWNNIGKYEKVHDGFFIFDEQRVVGRGAWVKSFLKISQNNRWVLLSATPGDTWSDYIPVFIANGFYRNRTEFRDRHIIWNPYTKYPSVQRYVDTRRLTRLRDAILVDMPHERYTTVHHQTIWCEYPKEAYREVQKNRWNIFEDRPVESAGELCLCLRKVVNSDDSRQLALLELFENHPKMIVFYSFDYELDILRKLFGRIGPEENLGEACGKSLVIAEWNGHKHEEVPDSDSWVYLVQYSAGCEGWNCIKTDTIVFYSQQYSWRVRVQAEGRIDRMNTPFKDLYYFHLKSHSGIDMAISDALSKKRDFNIGAFVGK